MLKKIVLALIALLILGAAFILFRVDDKEDASLKNIHIIIKTDEEVILDDCFETNTASLKDLLCELEKAETIVMDYEEGPYGMYIKALGKGKLYYEDSLKGLYWTYDSKNNATCLTNAFCPVADEVFLEDGDAFVFSLSSYAS